MTDLEEGSDLQLDFSKLSKVADTQAQVVPVVLQNARTLEVLYIGYANQLALDATIEEKRAVLWSTSRNELWRKGETSGDILKLVSVHVNCEQNSLLYFVEPVGRGVCHTKDVDGVARSTCYYRRIDNDQLVFESAG